MSDAKGKKPKKSLFKKGQTGNPNGRPTVPKEIREFKKLTAQQVEEIVSTLLYATETDIKDLLANPEASQLKRIVASILMATFESGNMTQFDQLLNRVIGKPKETIRHEGVRPVILDYGDGSKEIFTQETTEEE